MSSRFSLHSANCEVVGGGQEGRWNPWECGQAGAGEATARKCGLADRRWAGPASEAGQGGAVVGVGRGTESCLIHLSKYP
jgi:hypothetical protein